VMGVRRILQNAIQGASFPFSSIRIVLNAIA
jgi:hypothetical protein